MPALAGDTSFSTCDRKRALRGKMRARRVALSRSQRSHAARAAARHFLRHRLLARARHVGVYLAHGYELDTRPLLHGLAQRGCRLYAPVIHRSGRMSFVPINPRARCQRSALGVPQPARRFPRRRVAALDVLLLPLLAFDAAGHRLGQGGGYYDRALRVVSGRRRPLRLGYAYQVQEVARIDCEPWDIPLHGVLCDRGLRWTRG